VIAAIPTDLWNMIIDRISSAGIQNLLEVDIVYFNELIQKNGASYLHLALEFRRRGSKDDIKRARANLLKAARLVSPDAMLHLGVAYFDGGWGIKGDSHRAAYWFGTLAGHGNMIGAAFYSRCLKSGYGVARSTERSAEWARKVFDSEGEYFAKGYCHLHALGTHYNVQNAFVNMIKEDVSFDYHQHLMSLMCGACHQRKEEFDWCRKAAEQGLGHAQINFASLLVTRKSDIENGKIWLQKAHNQEVGMNIDAKSLMNQIY
jgi:TPR repeat protein